MSFRLSISRVYGGKKIDTKLFGVSENRSEKSTLSIMHHAVKIKTVEEFVVKYAVVHVAVPVPKGYRVVDLFS